MFSYCCIFSKFYSTKSTSIVLKKLLECDYYTAHKIFKNFEELQTYDSKLIEENINLLEQHGITKKDIQSHANVLLLDPFVTENRLYFLEEGGFKKYDCGAVCWFTSFTNKNRNILEAHGYIPQDADIIGSLLSHVEECPHVSPPSYNISKMNTLATMSDFVLKYYLCWRLDLDNKRLDKKALNNFRCKSFRIMSKTFKLLENEIGFSKEDIFKHSYVAANCNPHNIENILSSIQNLGGQDIKVVLKNNPKILLIHFKSILKISQHLQEYRIPNSSISNNFEIFTVDSNKVLEGLKEMESFPEFRAFRTHPRVLDLILKHEQVLTRMDHLKDLNLQCMSLNILHISKGKFQKFVDKGSDKASNIDIIQYLATALGEEKSIIAMDMTRHQLRSHVPFVTVQKTLKLLLKEGYTRDDILPNIQLTLYPWMLIKDHLTKLLTRPELSSQHLLTGEKPYFNKKQLLAFCLYFIERDYHFSGNGIWYRHTYKQEYLPDT